MYFDIDKIIAPDLNAQPEGDRIFSFDLFLSHRQHDSPVRYIESLELLGARVAWDNNLDLRDRRVLLMVSRAMADSRCIALYVSPQYTDSPWCKAEYLTALQSEDRFSIDRMVVILENETATTRVPSPLVTHPRFISNQFGLDATASHVLTANRLSLAGATKLRSLQDVRRSIGLDIELLDVEEKLYLLEQRLRAWLEVGGIPPTAAEKERSIYTAILLANSQFSELEHILREMVDLTLRSFINFAPRQDFSDATLARVVAIGDLVVAAFDESLTRKDAIACSEWMYDFMLLPLLLPISRDCSRLAATETYNALCNRLVHTSQKKFVPIYRTVGKAVGLYPGNAEEIVAHAFQRILIVENDA